MQCQIAQVIFARLLTGTGNQLLEDATWIYTYLPGGLLATKEHKTSGDTWTYSYNALGRMTSAVLTDSSNTILDEIAFVYDVFANRIADGDRHTSFDVTQGERQTATILYNVAFDLDINNDLVTRYLTGDRPDEMLTRIDTDVSHYLTDNLGSIRHITDATGDIIDSITYDSFGNVITETSPSYGDRFKFTAREYDATTGLYYYRARWFDPTTGRFTAMDPLSFDAGDVNLYRYVHNGPTGQRIRVDCGNGSLPRTVHC